MKKYRFFYSIIGILFWCLLSSNSSFGQRLNFTQYFLDQGLIQSQVTAIAQDPYRHLWISTYGGANRFDGQNFTSFTTDDGVENIMFNTVAIAPDGKSWFGNNEGLVCIDGKKITNYRFAHENTYGSIFKIVFIRDKIYALSNGELYQLLSGKLEIVKTPYQNYFITHIQVNNNGELFMSLDNFGIVKLEGKIWKAHVLLKEKMYIAKFDFDPKNNQNLFFISRNRLFESDGKDYKQIDKAILDQLPFKFSCIISDGKGGYWIGASEGAVHLVNHKITIYNNKNGYTNNHTSGIFKDAEQNIWFATNGDGIYKLAANSYTLIDSFIGLPNSVMSIAKAKDNTLLFGTINDGIFKLHNDQITNLKIPTANSDSKKIINLFMDSKDNLIVSTHYGGLWRYHHSKFNKLYPLKNSDPELSFGAAAEVEPNEIWITSNYGIYIYKNEKITKLTDFAESCSAILPISDHKVLVVTVSGVKLFSNGKQDYSFKIPAFKYLTAIQKEGNYLYLGTDNTGIIVLNMKNYKYKIISAKNGLYANNVYILAIVNHQLWVGTGLGINRFNIGKDPSTLTLLPSNDRVIAESSQNAFLLHKGKIYFGTSKGVLVFDPYKHSFNGFKPFIVIQKVNFSNKIRTNYVITSSYSLPEKLQLNHDQNDISFKFQGISMNDTKNVKYSYFLEGLNDKLKVLEANNFVNYVDLPPGKYSFMVKAIYPNKYETAFVGFSFEVLPAFYQTYLFKILCIFFLSLLIYGLYIYRLNKQELKIANEQLIRAQEQEKIRNQTAEDLHDDFGNKLTRINMISELLDKLTPVENIDVKSLIHQIKFSATEMYAGTKDLLWALNQKNDRLSVIINQVKKIFEETIKHTDIIFYDISMDTDYVDQNLPLGYSRNVILVAKEIATNLIRHSKAKNITLNIEMPKDNHYEFTFHDDGIGINLTKEFEGYGLKNLQNRATKLNGHIEFISSPNQGMKTVLTFIIPIT